MKIKVKDLRRIIREVLEETSDTFPPGRWTADAGEPADEEDLEDLGSGGFPHEHPQDEDK
jgi:hypothetical protein